MLQEGMPYAHCPCCRKGQLPPPLSLPPMPAHVCRREGRQDALGRLWCCCTIN